MSLILDALKKSEQERRRDKGPDLQTIHQPLPGAPQRSRNLFWLALLIAANAAVVAYWWQQRGVAPIAASAPPLTSPAPAVAPVKREPVPAATPSQQVPVAAANPEYTRITPNATASAANSTDAAARIEEVDELPEDIRNNLPAMTFSFHVYSSNPQQRTIIINNRRMREGEEINAGLQLQEITEDGVVLQYAQHRIHISVLAGW